MKTLFTVKLWFLDSKSKSKKKDVKKDSEIISAEGKNTIRNQKEKILYWKFIIKKVLKKPRKRLKRRS